MGIRDKRTGWHLSQAESFAPRFRDVGHRSGPCGPNGPEQQDVGPVTRCRAGAIMSETDRWGADPP
jgi:hypothetical protein